jgi:Icc-related predicted phosphoesterase
MNIQLISDLHLSNDPNFPDAFFYAEADVLVIAGDLCEVGRLNNLTTLFDRMSKTWKHVLYVLGNHEYYGSSLTAAPAEARRFCQAYDNIKLLNADVVEIDSVPFIGATLWTNMHGGNPVDMIVCQNAINDYVHIELGDKRDNVFGSWSGCKNITASDTVHCFNEDHSYFLEKFYDLHDFVVITHHAPSYKSIHECYKFSAVNSAFASDLDGMVEFGGAKIWVHGHIHNPVDYMIGNTRVVANPLGYVGEGFADIRDYRPKLITVRD